MSKPVKPIAESSVLGKIKSIANATWRKNDYADNEKPGFLILPILSLATDPDLHLCECATEDKCLNVSCLIRKGVDKHKDTVLDNEPAMLIVPIKKYVQKEAMETVTQCQEDLVNANMINDLIDGPTTNDSVTVKPDSVDAETNTEATVMEGITESPQVNYDDLCKQMDTFVHDQLAKLTNLGEPKSLPELVSVLKATESDKFFNSLCKKIEEIADTENGMEKVDHINKYFKSKGMFGQLANKLPE